MAGNLAGSPSIPITQDFSRFSFDASPFVPIDQAADIGTITDAHFVPYSANPLDTAANYLVPEHAIDLAGAMQDSYHSSRGDSSSTDSENEEGNESITMPDGKLRCNWLVRRTGARCPTECTRLCDLRYVTRVPACKLPSYR